MRRLTKKQWTFALAILAGGAAATVGTSASADVVCNRYGDCWHTSHHYRDYPVSLGIQFYPDSWWREHRHDRHYHWRERHGRGYYLHGRWHDFHH